MTQTPTPLQIPGPISPRLPLPGATSGFVLGICSIVLFVPVVGLVLGIVGLQLARKARRMAATNPSVYANAGLAQAGFVCSILGVIFGSLSTLSVILWWVLLMYAISAAY